MGEAGVVIAASVAAAPALAAIHAAAFPPGAAWDAAALAAQLRLAGVFAFLDVRGGMILARVAGGEGEVLTLAVAPAARRLGVARGLLERALAEAVSRGAGSVFLEVGTGNQAARGLYEGVGFGVVGRRARYYADGEDAVVMRWAVSGP